jgi:response regulator RpfG family c-di-GMP phosphodiesterase
VEVAIVDDTPTNVTLMQALVGKLDGCRPVSFTDSAAGLEWCLANQPDLVIVDYMMPAPDGLEFIRRLREVHQISEVPVLMVTADHEKQVRYSALESGATDFLTKPIDRIEFQSRVRNMLSLRRAHIVVAKRAAILAEEVAKATEVIYAREQETIVRLSRAAEFRDPETGAHILRMAHYAQLIASTLGMPQDFQRMLLSAAPMHDVGKLGTPDYILLKPGRLSSDEYEVMKNHTRIGHEILKGSSSPALQMAATIALTHHEKFDGSGYPEGLAKDSIPIEGRIVAVADVFDALTSVRPYKEAWDLPRAVAFIEEGCGAHFDPLCVRAFLQDWDAVLAVRERFKDDP